MPAFKACAVGCSGSGRPTTPTCSPGRRSHTVHSAHTETKPQPTAPADPQEGHPHAHQEPFLQGVYPFEGAGLDKPALISPELSYLVPDGVINQALYFRGGNTTDELITVVLMRDGVPMRYFPIGAKADIHVPLRVVEDIEGGSVDRAAAAGRAGRDRLGGGRPRHGGALR